MRQYVIARLTDRLNGVINRFIGTPESAWTSKKMQRTLRQLRARNLVRIDAGLVFLTERGQTHAHRFRQTQLTNDSVGELPTWEN